MKIAVIDDYQDAFRKTRAFKKLSAHEVVSYASSEKDPAKFVQRVEGCEAIVLTQQRSFLPRALVEKLPASVKLLAQTGPRAAHIDLAACTERGIIISGSGGGNSSATAELTWALLLALAGQPGFADEADADRRIAARSCRCRATGDADPADRQERQRVAQRRG